MNNRFGQWLDKHRSSVSVAFGIICAYILMFALGITCPIKFSTGVSCLGCGLTRAWLAALRFEFAEAFAYHPLFWLVPIAAVLFALEKRSRACRIAFYGIVGLSFAVYFVRLFDPSDAVVVFAPQDGALVLLLQKLLALLGF